MNDDVYLYICGVYICLGCGFLMGGIMYKYSQYSGMAVYLGRISNNLYGLCQGIHKTLNREMDDRADLIVCYIMSPDQPRKHCTTGHFR